MHVANVNLRTYESADHNLSFTRAGGTSWDGDLDGASGRLCGLLDTTNGGDSGGLAGLGCATATTATSATTGRGALGRDDLIE